MKMLALMFLFSTLAYAAPAAKKVTVEERWNKLMGLINHEMKILENAKRKGVEIKYRMLELHSEKLKLIHEKNNRDFMKISMKNPEAAKNKESYFKETREYYDITRRFGQQIIRDEVKNARKAEMYYALALNSRDYGLDNITEKYLLEALKIVGSSSTEGLRHHAQTALADYYYNEKKYSDAIHYYQEVIKKTEDDWMTKHLFNLSWCYLKTRQFERAIDTMKKSYFESKNPIYINIKDQALDNIGSFYVYAGKPLDGLAFYLENEKNPIPYLLPMALKASDKGHESETKEILDAAQKLVDKNNAVEYQEEVLHTYLDYYRHYNRFVDHEKVSRDLVAYYKKAAEETKKDKKSKFKMELKEDAIEKMRSLAGFLQIQIAKDVKKDESNFKQDDLDLVLKFFGHLIMLDSNRKVEYFYFRAETYFSVLQFKSAANSYVETVVEAKRVKNMDIARKALDSLLALTGQEELEPKENKKYLIFAYSHHVSFWPRDEKSEQMYPKLFEIYRESYQDVKATNVIRMYNKSYPEHLAEQQGFMTKILDQFIEKKNTSKINYWIGQFKIGFLSFPKETIEKTEIVLGNLLFIQYQELAKAGDRLGAAKGFESLYVHKLYPDKVKYQAAFFAAMAYLELGETVKSYYWQELAHARMTEEEKLERREQQLMMAERTYKLQDFATSFKSSIFLLKKYCGLKDKVQDRLYEITIMTTLVEEKPEVTERVIENFTKCLSNPELKDSALSQIYRYHEKRGDFFALRKFVMNNKVEPYTSQYRLSLQKWYWEKKDVNLKQHILNEYRALNHPETLTWYQEIQLQKSSVKDFNELANTIIWNKEKFDGELFNKSLEEYLLKLKNFKDKYQPLTQSSQVDLSILTTRQFTEVYAHVGKTIQSLRPQGLDEKTMKEFQDAMKGLSAQFISAAKEYEKSLAKALKEKSVLAWGTRSLASIDDIENPVFSFFTGLTMDRVRD